MTIPEESRSRFELLGALLLLAAMGAAIGRLWRDARLQGGAATTVDWLSVQTPLRATRSPGVEAWLRAELASARSGTSPALRDLLDTGPGNRVPALLADAASAMDAVLDASSQHVPDAEPVRRAVRTRAVGEQVLVATAPNAARSAPNPPAADEGRAQALLSLGQRFLEPSVLPDGLHVVRAYFVGADGEFLSLPLAGSADETAAARVEREVAELSKNAEVPVFGTQAFFFEARGESRVRCSGPYLDLGGSGLVCTLLADAGTAESGGVFAVDLALDLDWSRFAAEVSEPVTARRIRCSAPPRSDWQPWSELERCATDLPADLSGALAGLGLEERRSDREEARATVHRATWQGRCVVALQVSAEDWLLLSVPTAPPRTPLAALVLCGLAIAALFLRSEQSRRHALRARRRALAEAAEREHLLETMQVPLVVVDPNNDEIAFSNRAAEDLGIAPRQRFGADVVAADDRAQAHYRAMQTLDGRPRRAYGVPLRSEGGARYAIVRSVAVKAPIASLRADERHRLGILFVLDEGPDLGYFLEERLREGRADERARLASLLDHGLDRSARALAVLAERAPALAARFAARTARRVESISWLLEHWDRDPPPTFPIVLGRESFEHSLELLRHWFEAVRDDGELRRKLGWNNGTLSAPAPSGEVLRARLRWPDGVGLPMPQEGLLGLLLEECLSNAVRHGRPGSVPSLRLEHDAGRGDFTLTLENECAADEAAAKAAPSRSYRGTALVDEIARVSRFTAPERERDRGVYRLRLRMDAVRTRPAEIAD